MPPSAQPVGPRRLTRRFAALTAGFLLGVSLSSFAAEKAADQPGRRTGVFPFHAYAARYDIWAFTPMDQGGRQVQLQVIGSERDEDIVRAVRTPGFFSPWGHPLKWDSLESTELEKSVWLNRWYFLPSLARRFHLTGDKSHLGEIMDFVRRWRDENPPPADVAAYIASRQRNWRDMQAAWRVQNLAWCYFLGREGFSSAEKSELYDLIDAHAQVLLDDFGTRAFNENNHQSHGATTMLFAALLFPDIRRADELKTKALAILEHHLDAAFHADGNSVELCPGYYPFFVSIFRDAYLLCRANGVTPPRRSEERLRQFHHYITHVAQPDGTMPPINDSTESDSAVSLEVLAELFALPSRPTPPTSLWFHASHQAVMRDARPDLPVYAFLDAGPRVASHWHGGKLGFHLWFWDRALVVDSGICNYDEPHRREWYAHPRAHNTVLVDGQGDYDTRTTRASRRPLAGSAIAHWESNEQFDWAVMTHTGLADGVQWTRHFILLKGFGCLVIDRLQSDRPHDYTALFHLAPGDAVSLPERRAVFTNFPEKNVLIQAADPSSRVAISEGLINRNSRNLRAPVAEFRFPGSNVVQSFLLLPAAGSVAPEVVLSQELAENGIQVRTSAGGTTAVVNIRWGDVANGTMPTLQLQLSP